MAGELSSVAKRNATGWLLLAPSCLALVLLFVVPIGYVLLLSVTDPRLSLAHYQRIFTVPVYTRVMVNTFVTSLIVTTLCLVIGYPIAYVMARRAGWVSTLLLTIVAMSFWTGFLVRTYAWLVILGSKGPVAAAYGAGRWMESLLAGVSPHDPAVFGAAVATALVLTLLGTLLPALRAARVSPLEATRE